MKPPEIVIGTANFGQRYGLSRRAGGISQRDIHEILELATSSGITWIDSAISYGDAHAKLGLTGSLVKKFRLITKASPDHFISYRKIKIEIIKVLSVTGLERIDYLLAHDASDFILNHSRYIEIFGNLMDEELIMGYGVSCYSKTEILDSFSLSPEIGYLQVPENVMDQRLVNDPSLQFLREKGILFGVRSIFLQGMLLQPVELLPRSFDRYKEYFEAAKREFELLGMTQLQGNLLYAEKIPWASQFVLGVENAQNLSQILVALNTSKPDLSFAKLKAPSWVVDPRMWK